MSTLTSIVSCGLYVPHLRLERARIAEALAWMGPMDSGAPAGFRAICSWDEDSLTMAVEAGRDCLAAVAPSTAVPASVTLASTTLPFADRSNATVVAGALDLPESIRSSDRSGSLRAATTALAELAERGERAPSLLIASDARLARPGSAQEMQFGAGAAAVLITSDPDTVGLAPVADILAAQSLTADFVDHYRMSTERFDYALENRWIRDEGIMKLVGQTICRALAQAGLSAGDVDYLVMPGAPGTVRQIAEATGLGSARLQSNLHESCGDTGTAHPLLMLAGALGAARPGQRIVLVGFGQGVDALVLVAAQGAGTRAGTPIGAILERGTPEPHYTRYLAHCGLLEPHFGMRAERESRTAHTVAWRKRRQTTAFVGGMCRECGTVQFPKSRICVNPQCRRLDTQEDHRLADTIGRVKTFTEDWQAYSPRPPYVYGNVELQAGGNLLMEFADLDPGELAVGDQVRFVFRIKDFDRLRAYRRYFWKAKKV
ncbi:MAG: OB-fold domain-containing protein [Steroidobacteraceae bacterium]